MLDFNQKMSAIHQKYDIHDMPGVDCKLNPGVLAAFFADLLQLHDQGSDENKDLPLPTRLFLNRRFNNTYVHLTNTFPPKVVKRVHALCRSRSIGDAFRSKE